MINSMTGFGKGEASSSVGAIAVELRSVNHRYFEMQAHLPSYLSDLEDRLRERLRTFVRRGRITLSATFRQRGTEALGITIDAAAALRYHGLLARLRTTLGVREEVRLEHILSLPKVVISEEAPKQETRVRALAEAALTKAARALVATRRREGVALARDVLTHVGTLESSLEDVATRAPHVVTEHRERLRKRLETIQAVQVDAGRLETEIAIFAEARDISEEVARLHSHLSSVRRTLNDGDEAGRKLDFLAQELFREVNTIGSKAADTTITNLVIRMKGAIEKLREQVQNIE